MRQHVNAKRESFPDVDRNPRSARSHRGQTALIADQTFPRDRSNFSFTRCILPRVSSSRGNPFRPHLLSVPSRESEIESDCRVNPRKILETSRIKFSYEHVRERRGRAPYIERNSEFHGLPATRYGIYEISRRHTGASRNRLTFSWIKSRYRGCHGIFFGHGHARRGINVSTTL